MTDPIQLAVSLATRLPHSDMLALSRAAAGGTDGIRTLRASASSNLIRHACDQATLCLTSHSGEFLAGALAAAAATTGQNNQTQRLDVVWTGPTSRITTSRLTSAAVVSLIAEARDELLLVSYATYPDPAITLAMSAAAARGVEITLLLERHSDNPRFTASGTPFPALSARRLSWPADARQRGASLHAKIVIVDAVTALVGSANITGSAMEINLECGILIRGGPHPRAIRDHIYALADDGTLRRADAQRRP